MRWADNIAKHIGKKWMTSAEDRQDWHNQPSSSSGESTAGDDDDSKGHACTGL